MTRGIRVISLFVSWTSLGCGTSPEEIEDRSNPPTETAESENESIHEASREDPRRTVGPDQLCTQFEERASRDDIWANWVDRMNEEVGDCRDSVAALEASLDENYPGRGRRLLGVYDRCADEEETPTDYWNCVQEAIPRVVQRIEDEQERESASPSPRARKGGERRRPRGKKGRGRR